MTKHIITASLISLISLYSYADPCFFSIANQSKSSVNVRLYNAGTKKMLLDFGYIAPGGKKTKNLKNCCAHIGKDKIYLTAQPKASTIIMRNNAYSPGGLICKHVDFTITAIYPNDW